MISKFLREQKRYTLSDLINIFECNEEKTKKITQKLKAFGVLKSVKKSDIQFDLSELQDNDIEITNVEDDSGEYFYVFTYVGLITIAGRILKIFPKYIINQDNPLNEFKQILKVIEKYNSKEQIIKIFNDCNNAKNYNLLATLLFLINDFYENGTYSDSKTIIEDNGQGEILWEKTVNETYAIITNQRPFYTQLKTKRAINNNDSYIKNLYECILTKSSTELKQADLLDLFDITPVELSSSDIEDFGDTDYILYRIEKELEQEFNTRKQLVLKVLYTYIVKESSINNLDGLSMYGTNCFNMIWEKVCAIVMNNLLNTRLSQLELPTPINKTLYKNSTLIDLIEKPYWSKCGKCAKDTLIPDIVTFCKKDSQYYFLILDAKYYYPTLVKGEFPKNQPGIESITKQYLYNLAYKDFSKKYKFDYMKNYFILPTNDGNVKDMGCVELKMLNNLDLEPISVKLIPAQTIFEKYLTNESFDLCCILH